MLAIVAQEVTLVLITMRTNSSACKVTTRTRRIEYHSPDVTPNARARWLPVLLMAIYLPENNRQSRLRFWLGMKPAGLITAWITAQREKSNNKRISTSLSCILTDQTSPSSQITGQSGRTGIWHDPLTRPLPSRASRRFYGVQKKSKSWQPLFSDVTSSTRTERESRGEHQRQKQ